MMHKRLSAAKKLLTKDGVLICAIDKYEQATLSLLIDGVFPSHEITCVTVIHNPAGTQGNNFSYTNEYLLFVFPQNGVYINKSKREDALVSAFRDWGTISLRSQAKTCFYPIIVKDDKIVEFGDVCSDDFHPGSSNIKQSDGTVLVFPIDKKGVERKWVFSRGSVEEVKKQLHCKNIGGEISIFRTKGETNYKTVWDDKKYYANIYGSKLLNQIIDSNFPFPKSLHAVIDSIRAVIHSKNATILDFFAGSGTSGHAVLELNKEDGGNRKFILCTNNEFGIEDEKKIMEKYKINRKEFEQEVNNETKKWHEWRDEYGIASTATFPRIKNIIKGYTKPNSEKVKGFGGSLEYFKTRFVDVENIDKVSDKKKLEFTYEAGQMIALKEDTFKEVTKNKFYQIFTDEKNKFVGIYFRENLDKLAEMEKNILDKKDVKLYLFSYGVNDFKKDYSEYKNVVVTDIPEPILKIYKSLNS
jgi:adenine-specific DNA-methyltransferase